MKLYILILILIIVLIYYNTIEHFNIFSYGYINRNSDYTNNYCNYINNYCKYNTVFKNGETNIHYVKKNQNIFKNY
jgi:hypothetical protein